MNTFISSIAHYLLQTHHQNLKDCTLVFPGRRAGLFLIKELSLQAGKPLFTPQITTLDELTSQITGLQKGDPLLMLYYLYQSFEKIYASNKTFDEFIHTGNILLTDFNEIDSECVNASKLFANIIDLKEIDSLFANDPDEVLQAILDFWKLYNEKDKTVFGQKFLTFWRKLLPLYSDFSAKILSKKIAYNGLIVKTASENQKMLDDYFENSHIKNIYFIGFNALTDAEEKLFFQFKKSGKASFFWDCDEFFLKKYDHEAGTFIRENLKKFPMPHDYKDAYNNIFSQYTQEKQIQVIPTPQITDQSRIIGSIIEKRNSDNENTLIVLSDETLLLPVLHALPEKTQVNVTMGYPLKLTGAYALLDSLIKMYRNQKTGNETNYFMLNDVYTLINNPLIQHIVKSVSFKELYEQKRRVISVETCKTFAPLSFLFQFEGDILSFIAFLLNVFNNLAIASENKDVDESGNWINQQALISITGELKKINETINKHEIPIQSLSVLSSFIKKFIQPQTLSFIGEPIAGLQLMGLLETRTTDFENIIIVSANEGVLPKTSSRLSYIPMSLREGFGMKTMGYDEAIFAYNFYRLIQRGKNIWITYATGQGITEKADPSRYLLQMKFDGPHQLQYHTVDNRPKIIPLEAPIIVKDESIDAILQKYKMGEIPFSASAINTLIDCNLKFYFNYIALLKLENEILENDENENLILGSLFHHSIEILYNNHFKVNQVIEKKDFDVCHSDAIDKAITEAFYTFYEFPANQTFTFNGTDIIHFEIIKKYIIEFINFDKSRTPFTYLGHELKKECRFKDSEIKFKGRLDSLRLINGVMEVSDYKIGKIDKLNISIENCFDENQSFRNYMFQLIFYYYLLIKDQNQEVNTGLISVRNLFSGKAWVQGFNKETADTPQFESLLEDIFANLFDESIPFIPTENADTCNFCNYKSICGR